MEQEWDHAHTTACLCVSKTHRFVEQVIPLLEQQLAGVQEDLASQEGQAKEFTKEVSPTAVLVLTTFDYTEMCVFELVASGLLFTYRRARVYGGVQNPSDGRVNPICIGG